MILAVTLISALFISDTLQAAPAQKVCATEDGKILVRRKCRAKKNELTLDLAGIASNVNVETIAGPAGPAGAQGASGSSGPQGEKGDKGEKGDPGLSATFDVTPVLATYTPTIAAGENYLAFGGFCPQGQYSISGSCNAPDDSKLTLVTHGVNRPDLDDHFSYRCVWRNQTGSPVSEFLQVKIFCITIPENS